MSWIHEGQDDVSMIKFRIRWQSTSMYLVHSWKTWFLVICMAVWLSQCNLIKPLWWTPNLLSKRFIQTSSHVVFAIAHHTRSRYNRLLLTLLGYKITTKNIHYPVIDLRLVEQPTQLASVNVAILLCPRSEYMSPLPRDPLMYLRIW
jgi:hypothetical protein